MDAFDADVLIYAAAPHHPEGERVRALIRGPGPGSKAGVGSVVLIPELLSRPLRSGDRNEASALAALLGRLELRVTDEHTAQVAAALGAKYGLRAADAVHLATAVVAGADRFLTNNRKDFPRAISEVDITYPRDLPKP